MDNGYQLLLKNSHIKEIADAIKEIGDNKEVMANWNKQKAFNLLLEQTAKYTAEIALRQLLSNDVKVDYGMTIDNISDERLYDGLLAMNRNLPFFALAKAGLNHLLNNL